MMTLPDLGGGADLSPDYNVPCEVDGISGKCMDVAACDGIPTPGFCPGPVTIQCCTGQPVAPHL
jgi:hypothetical protein